jgi:putative DNA primase/helicase
MDAPTLQNSRAPGKRAQPTLPDLRAIARALGGEIIGGQVLCPGPSHSPTDRSLAIRLSAESPFGFIAHSHAGDDWRVCRDYVLGKLGEPTWRPADRESRAPAPAWIHEIKSTDLWKRIWRESEPLGRLALDYFASRGLHELPLPGVESVLRFHPRAPFGPGERHPCIVALVRSVVTNQPQGVHRTALTPEGRKLDRKMLGPKTGGQ